MSAGLPVRQAMSAPVVTAPPTATLEEVAREMLAHRVGCVVVVDPDGGGRPIGIVTATDFEVSDDPVPLTFFRWPKLFGRHVWSPRSLRDVYARARTRSAASIMSAPVRTVEADADVWDAVRVMVAHDVKRVPVVERERLVGIVTRHDLLKYLVRDPAGTASP
jgi:CBS domain-containing protein